MGRAILATALLATLIVRIPPPHNFTPIPAAHGTRECSRSECRENCGANPRCQDLCSHCSSD